MAMNPIPILSTSPPPFDDQNVEDSEFNDSKWKPFAAEEDDKDELFEPFESVKQTAQTTQSFDCEPKTTNGEKITNGDQSSSESEDNGVHFNFTKRLNLDCEVTSCRSLELPDLDANVGEEVLNSNQSSPFHVRSDPQQEDADSDFGDFATAFDGNGIAENNDVLNFVETTKNGNFVEDFNGCVDAFRNEIIENKEKCEKEKEHQVKEAIDSAEFDDFADFACFRGNESTSNVNTSQQKWDNEAFECSVSEEMSTKSNLVLKPLPGNVDDDDDFADMCSAPPVSDTCLSHANQNDSNLDESGDLDDFSEFADFQQSVPSTDLMNSNDNKTQLSNLVKEIFAIKEEAADLGLSEEVAVNRDLMNNKSSFGLWTKLQCLEETPSLKLKWQTSHSFQMFLNSLRIDPRNILHNPCVPKFAAGLGLLEPIKSTQLQQPSTISANSNNINNSDATCTVNADAASSSTVPPVSFDWNLSGLLNPLEHKKTTELDFDIFMNADTRKATATKTEKKTTVSDLEKELLKDEPATSTQVTKSSITNDTLYQLMSNNKYSSIPCSLNKRPPNLSREANQILDELPVLSFIRAKVLMFPVNGSN